MTGKTEDEVRAELKSKGMGDKQIEDILPHKVCAHYAHAYIYIGFYPAYLSVRTFCRTRYVHTCADIGLCQCESQKYEVRVALKCNGMSEYIYIYIYTHTHIYTRTHIFRCSPATVPPTRCSMTNLHTHTYSSPTF
jgi:hypothetical protein